MTYEYPDTWNEDKEPYYPINDKRNNAVANEYKRMAEAQGNVLFGGRLGQYAYFDMDDTIAEALRLFRQNIM